MRSAAVNVLAKVAKTYGRAAAPTGQEASSEEAVLGKNFRRAAVRELSRLASAIKSMDGGALHAEVDAIRRNRHILRARFQIFEDQDAALTQRLAQQTAEKQRLTTALQVETDGTRIHQIRQQVDAVEQALAEIHTEIREIENGAVIVLEQFHEATATENMLTADLANKVKSLFERVRWATAEAWRTLGLALGFLADSGAAQAVAEVSESLDNADGRLGLAGNALASLAWGDGAIDTVVARLEAAEARVQRAHLDCAEGGFV